MKTEKRVAVVLIALVLIGAVSGTAGAWLLWGVGAGLLVLGAVATVWALVLANTEV